MRARLIRPELASDEVLGELPDEVVLFYLKLWMLCDDEGYFEWRPKAIAAQLYPYRDGDLRHGQAVEWLSVLADAKRLGKLECGVHGRVPSIPRYRIQAGKPSEQIRREHRRSCTSSESVRSGLLSESSSESLSESSLVEIEKNGSETVERVPPALVDAPWNKRATGRGSKS